QARDDRFFYQITLQAPTLGDAPKKQIFWTTKDSGTGGFLNVRVFSWDGKKVTQLLQLQSLPKAAATIQDGKIVTTEAVFAPGDPECCPSSCKITTYIWKDGAIVTSGAPVSGAC